MEMSITRALSELKLIDKKISDKTQKLIVSASVQSESEDVKAAFIKSETEKLQQVKDFIVRRNKIKAAIVQSNASTVVRIAGEGMKVAEAIERKNSIQLEKSLHQRMHQQYYGNKDNVERQNEGVKQKADRQAEAALGAETVRAKGDEYTSIVEAYIKHNEFKLLSVVGVEDLIENMQDKIDEFESEVDFVLSESNTKTVIEV